MLTTRAVGSATLERPGQADATAGAGFTDERSGSAVRQEREQATLGGVT